MQLVHSGYNEVVPGEGIVHICSCGWRSRACFSNAVASIEGMEHRARAKAIAELVSELEGQQEVPYYGA